MKSASSTPDIIKDSNCDCVTTRFFEPKYHYEVALCKQHKEARKNMKPYSKYVSLNRGLCPYCHGYDEVTRQSACICNVYTRLQELEVIINTMKEGATIEQLEKEDIELLEEVQRVRKRRGKEQ